MGRRSHVRTATKGGLFVLVLSGLISASAFAVKSEPPKQQPPLSTPLVSNKSTATTPTLNVDHIQQLESSEPTTSLVVNGEQIELPPNETVERVINDNSTTTTIHAENNQSAHTENNTNVQFTTDTATNNSVIKTTERSQLRLYIHQNSSE